MTRCGRHRENYGFQLSIVLLEKSSFRDRLSLSGHGARATAQGEIGLLRQQGNDQVRDVVFASLIGEGHSSRLDNCCETLLNLPTNPCPHHLSTTIVAR